MTTGYVQFTMPRPDYYTQLVLPAQLAANLMVLDHWASHDSYADVYSDCQMRGEPLCDEVMCVVSSVACALAGDGWHGLLPTPGDVDITNIVRLPRGYLFAHRYHEHFGGMWPSIHFSDDEWHVVAACFDNVPIPPGLPSHALAVTVCAGVRAEIHTRVTVETLLLWMQLDRVRAKSWERHEPPRRKGRKPSWRRSQAHTKRWNNTFRVGSGMCVYAEFGWRGCSCSVCQWWYGWTGARYTHVKRRGVWVQVLA